MRRSARGTMAAIGAALVIGAGGTAASAGPFSTARSPGWRVVRYFGQCSSAGVLSVTATGPLDAWATGQAWRFQCDQPGLLIARWDGRTWQGLEPPARFAVAPGRQSVGHAVAALSSSYSWTFVNHVSFPHAAVESFALLWRNGRWRTFRLHDGATLTSAVTFSRSNAWAFGGIANFAPYMVPYAVHFNGKWWRHVVVPVLAFGIAAPSPRNIWAVGPTEFDRVPLTAFKLAHWDGKQWSAMAVPFPQDPDLGIVRASVLSDGSRGAWVAEDLSNFGASGKLVNSGALLHWTGRIWQEVHLPFKTAGLGPLARDGHGGLWVASLRASVCAVCDDLDMAHYRAGRWTLTRAHVQGATVTVTAMRLIPGTTSVWASVSGVLSTDGQDDTTGAILKYGP